MVDVVKTARVGFGLQINHFLWDAHAGHIVGHHCIALFAALVWRLTLLCGAVKAEARAAIEVSESAGEPNESAGGIAHRAVVHPGFKIAEADETPDVYGFPDAASFDIEDDTGQRHVGRDLVEFDVVARLDHAGYADDVRTISLRPARDFGRCGWCCDGRGNNRGCEHGAAERECGAPHSSTRTAARNFMGPPSAPPVCRKAVAA